MWRIPALFLCLTLLWLGSLAATSVAVPLGAEQAVPLLTGGGELGGTSGQLDRAAPLADNPTAVASLQGREAFFADILRAHPAAGPTCYACADPVSRTLEPAALLLFGAALAGTGLLLRRRLRRAGRLSGA
jgi:hypothetical protein